MNARRTRAPGRVVRSTTIAAATGIVLALTACNAGAGQTTTDADATGSGTTDSGTTDASDAAAGQCGTVPDLGAEDPDGVLADLGDLAEYYNGFTYPVLRSAWADWAPDHEGPYTAGVVTNPLSNPFQTNLHDGLIAGLESAGVEVVADLAAASQQDVAAQSQQFQQVLSQGPDIIFFGPVAAEPAIELVNAAGEADIPVVALHQATNSEYAVSVAYNNVLEAMHVGAGVVDHLGGEGTLLRVHGVPGIAQDNEASLGFDAVLEHCPDISQTGEVSGMYQSAASQQAVVQYLATNPAGVDGVLSSGVMGQGIIQAFEQAGQPLGAIADLGSSKASVAFAEANPELGFFGTAAPAYAMGERMADVGTRILAGQGPKVNQMLTAMKVIEQDNLDEFYEDGFALTDPSGVEGDPDDYFPAEHLDQLFTDPERTLP